MFVLKKKKSTVTSPQIRMKSNALLDQVMHLAICFSYCKRMMARDCKCQFYRVLSVPNSVMLMAKKRIIENLGTGPSPLDFNCLRVSLIVTRFQAGQQGGEEVGLNLERQKSSACKSSLTKHLGMNTQLFRCMYGNSFFMYKLSSAQLGLKSSTEIISFAWVSWLLSFVLESFTSITACAAFKGWKMHQLSKWLRKAHQKNRLLDWGTSKGNRSQEILCIAFRCWNWKLCSSTSGHWDHCRIARDLMLTTSFFLWAGIIGITTTAIGVFAKAPLLTLWRSGDLNLTEAMQRWSCASPWQALLSGLCQAFCWKEKDINYKIFSWMLFNSTTSPFVIPSRQFPSPMDQQKMQVFKEFYESSVLILTSHGLIYEEWEQDKKYKRRLLNNKSEVMPKLLGVLTCAFPILSLCKEKQNTLVNSFTLWSQYDPPMSFAECAGYFSSWSSSNVLMLCSYPVLTVNISSWLCSRETVLKLWSAKSFVKKKRLFFFLQYMHL